MVRRLAALPPDVGFVLASRRPLDPSRQDAAARTGRRARTPRPGSRPAGGGPRARGGVRRARPRGSRAGPRPDRGVARPRASRRRHPGPEPGSDLAEALSRPGSATSTWVAANVLTAIPEELGQALGLVAELGPVTQTVLDRVAAALGLPCPDAAVPPPRPARSGGRATPGRSHEPDDRRTRGGPGDDGAAPPGRAGCGRPSGPPRAPTRPKGSPSRRLARSPAPGTAQPYAGSSRPRARPCSGRATPGRRRASSRRSGTGTEVLQRTYADALRLSGEPGAALRAFQPLVSAADRTGWTVELATRVAAVHHTLGNYRETLETLERATPAGEDPEQRTSSALEWLAFRARAMAMLGLREQARPLAVTTLTAARAPRGPPRPRRGAPRRGAGQRRRAQGGAPRAGPAGAPRRPATR